MKAVCLVFVVFILFLFTSLKSAFAVAPSMTSYSDKKIFIALGIAFLALCAIVISYPYIDKWRKERFNG